MTESPYPPLQPSQDAADTQLIEQQSAGSPSPNAKRWPWIAAIIAAFVVGGGIGVLSGIAGTPSAEENQATIDAAMSEERTALATAQADADRKTAEAKKATDAAAKETQAAKDAQAANAKDAATVTAQLDQRSADLDKREAALTPREVAAARSTFGNGLHRVGVDVDPGTYRTTGGGNCYWERLSGTSGEFDDIIANDLPTGASVVTISGSDAAFKSQGCGTWSKTS